MRAGWRCGVGRAFLAREKGDPVTSVPGRSCPSWRTVGSDGFAAVSGRAVGHSFCVPSSEGTSWVVGLVCARRRSQGTRAGHARSPGARLACGRREEETWDTARPTRPHQGGRPNRSVSTWSTGRPAEARAGEFRGTRPSTRAEHVAAEAAALAARSKGTNRRRGPVDDSACGAGAEALGARVSESEPIEANPWSWTRRR